MLQEEEDDDDDDVDLSVSECGIDLSGPRLSDSGKLVGFLSSERLRIADERIWRQEKVEQEASSPQQDELCYQQT